MWIGEHEVDLHVVIDGKQADSVVHLGVQGVRMEEIASRSGSREKGHKVGETAKGKLY